MAHHHHDCGHTHHHHADSHGRAFAVGVTLNLIFVAIEFFYGYVSNSMALVADAGHNLSDVLGLALAWGAAVLARRRPTATMTYGLRRSSILAALANAVLLLLAIGGIAWESVHHLIAPEPVAGKTVMIVAAIGVVVNAVSAAFFLGGHHHDLNVHGAFLHLVMDAAISLGVVAAGGVILATGWTWVDPVISLAIGGLVCVGTWRLLRDAVTLALDGVPGTVDIIGVKKFLLGLPGCREVHDLHVWAMSTTETALTAHLVMDRATYDDDFLARIGRDLHDRFGIEHTTIQIETGTNTACRCHIGLEDSVRGEDAATVGPLGFAGGNR